MLRNGTLLIDWLANASVANLIAWNLFLLKIELLNFPVKGTFRDT